MVTVVGKWLGLAVSLALLLGVSSAEAHGKEVNIAVACVTSDPGRPLTKVCEASLKYPDGDPVTEADFQLTATREGKAERPIGPVKFKPLEQEGLYSATMTFPAYGRWQMRFAVNKPDSGEVEMVEEVLPPAPGASAEIRTRLQVVFAFGLADIRNIALRVIHLLAAISLFALSALVLILSRFAVLQQQWSLLQRLAGVFPWYVGTSVLVLAISGALSALYNTPTRSPGLFAPEFIARLPFGEAYLMAFLLKMALGTAILATTTALALSLRRAYGSRTPMMSGADRGFPFPSEPGPRRVTWLAAINLLLGLLVLIDVVVLGYLHIISHVGAAAAGG